MTSPSHTKKGNENKNVDAFSRLPCAVTTVSHQDQMVKIRRAQRADKVLSTLQKVVQVTDQLWNKYPLKRYWQLWHQLTVRNGVPCRTYTPSPLQDEVTVPVLPPSLRQETLYQCHDLPTAGHQGMEKTLERLRKEAYWVGITRDVDNYCRRCLVCQAAKHVTPTKAPLVNTPIGWPWQMVVADILEVPLSTNNNWYHLVVQATSLSGVKQYHCLIKQQVESRKELTKIFTTYGCPDIFHSDQGRNFESTVLRSACTEGIGYPEDQNDSIPSTRGWNGRAFQSVLTTAPTMLRATSE